MNLYLIQYRLYYFLLAFLLLQTACSSQVPAGIKTPLAAAPTIEQVRKSPEEYISKTVRWGGVIINTENRKDSSRLTIVAYPLSKYGEPLTSKNSVGRFIVSFSHFLEPQVYSHDRVITVLGKIITTEAINVGDFPYNYPVISVQQHFLWPVDEPQEPLYPPWWYDPYYWPYHPLHHHYP